MDALQTVTASNAKSPIARTSVIAAVIALMLVVMAASEFLIAEAKGHNRLGRGKAASGGKRLQEEVDEEEDGPDDIQPPPGDVVGKSCKRTPNCGSFRYFACCHRVCVDIVSDPKNCASCGRTCRTGLSCCDGFCVNTKTNPRHCGECYRRCQPPFSCINGLCGY
ncbi:hypothetical protein CBR_g12687 [Chara braunii]|uniref:Uncharacterized protein n=1 Tax=Chara braunii TaxID=69332 RepID=A0A388KSJ6_CHABU|nr:hypothetical protein CBR_g12687 [Chara braunii]|eukprot:GBG72968.1 hypothetical protein CBR_g12687 [Chara braunii]